MKHELRLFLIALQFFTRVPVPAWVGYHPDWLNACARYFPLVGAFVGSVAAAVLTATSSFFSSSLSAWLAIAATMMLTGAFHEDGLADTCDALGGYVPRERALEIMKDSRIGTYGAAGLLVTLAIKANAIASLAPFDAGLILVLAHTASRAAAVALIHVLPYAGDLDRAKAKPLANQISSGGVLVAFVWPVLAAGVVVALKTEVVPAVLVSAAAAALTALLLAGWFRRRVGGFTGDLLGATQQACEVMMLLVWAAWTTP